MKVTLRKPETQKLYEKQLRLGEKGCSICKVKKRGTIASCGSFILTLNELPYDNFPIPCTNYMFILKKHKKFLTRDELFELQGWEKKLSYQGKYDYVFKNSPAQASVVNHWHYHLLKRK